MITYRPKYFAIKNSFRKVYVALYCYYLGDSFIKYFTYIYVQTSTMDQIRVHSIQFLTLDKSEIMETTRSMIVMCEQVTDIDR